MSGNFLNLSLRRICIKIVTGLWDYFFNLRVTEPRTKSDPQPSTRLKNGGAIGRLAVAAFPCLGTSNSGNSAAFDNSS